MENLQPMELSLEQLLLDPNNFRFQGEPGHMMVAERRYAESTVQKAAHDRHVRDGILDLRASIIENGYLPVDRIVVKPYGDSSDELQRYVVIEGNRRTATLILLQSEHTAGVEIPDNVQETFNAVPCVELTGNDPGAELAIMGVRHVGGIKEWGGYQGARIVWLLKHDAGVPTSEVAAKLGLSAQEVNRRYRAYRAVEQMRVDDEFGEFASSEQYALFHEAIAAKPVREHFGWDTAEASFTDQEKIQDFYRLICPFEDDEGSTRPAKIRSYTEVRSLKGVVTNFDATASLEDLHEPLANALAIANEEQERHSWKQKVSATTKALGKIGLDDLESLSTGDIEALNDLREKIQKLIAQQRAIASVTG